MPFSNGIRIDHVLVLGVFLFVRHAFGKSFSARGSDSFDEGEHEEHEEGFVVRVIFHLVKVFSISFTSDGVEFIQVLPVDVILNELMQFFYSLGIPHGF